MDARTFEEHSGVEPDCGDCDHHRFDGKRTYCTLEEDGIECDFFCSNQVVDEGGKEK